MSTDISALANRPVIIGGGAAGLMTALHLAPEPVLLLSKAPLGAEASSLWAQGGLAAAMGDDDDPALHLADTIAAGAGLCDEAVARPDRRRGARGGRTSRTAWRRLRPPAGWRLAARPRSRARPQPDRACHRRRHRPRDHARADRSGAPLSVDHVARRRRGARPDRRGQRHQGRARRERQTVRW